MKFSTQSKERVQPGNLSGLESQQNVKLKDSKYYPLLWVIAQAFDEIADGENTYLIVGSTQSGNAFTLTVVSGGAKTTAYAPSLDALGDAIASLVTD